MAIPANRLQVLDAVRPSVRARHTFVLVGFTNEDEGLVVSKFYVHELGQEGQHKTSAMVNLDSLGLSATKLELDRADKKLAKALAAVAADFKLP